MLHKLLYLAPLSIAFARTDWSTLREQLGDRLHEGVPYAQSCFTGNGQNATECAAVQAGYVDAANRTSNPNAYMNVQWETCQATGAQCTLDYIDPTNLAAFSSPAICQMGSIANYYIDVQSNVDVATAFNFSRETGVPLVIKNTGHDFIGRSSAPGSLSLWTHNLKNISFDASFVPEGTGLTPHPAITMAAGVQWIEAYTFADAHNVTILGGTDPTVGTVGGWLQGGGHTALSNTLGMGVDHVLQFKVVTPDGQTRIANAAQNSDLFWALRGGGGGTFGLVLEASVQALPPVTLQRIMVAIPSINYTMTEHMYTLMVDNGLQWAEDGWGGYASLGAVFFVTPKLNASTAAISMAPLLEFGKQVQDANVGFVETKEYTSWLSFFTEFFTTQLEFSGGHQPAGYSVAMASRLIPKANFRSVEKRAELVKGLLEAYNVTDTILYDITAPTSFPGNNDTSVTPAWRESVYHVTSKVFWNWDASKDEKKAAYETVREAIKSLRNITPDAAYPSESDVYEPNHEVAFWGMNYARLLTIKQKYDPEHLLDCWHCVGWEPSSARFSCYL